MLSTEETERRLRSLFAGVGELVDSEPGELRLQRLRLAIETAEGEQPRPSSPRVSRWGIAAIVAPAALLLSTTAAAASPGNPPSLSQLLGGANVLLSSAAVIEQSSAQMRVSVSGPDDARLEVFSMPVGMGNSVAGSCDRLVVLPAGATNTSATLAAGEMACSLVGSSGASGLNPQQILQARSGVGQAVSAWTSPAGVQYKLVYGSAESGSASVALTALSGAEGASAKVADGWFILYIPKSEISQYPYLRFYRADGSVLDTLPGKF